jgi:hypothetical protein
MRGGGRWRVLFNTVTKEQNLSRAAYLVASEKYLVLLVYFGAWCGVVFKAVLLVGLSRDRFPVVSLDFSVTYFFRAFHGPEIDSAPSENEYQEHSWR